MKAEEGGGEGRWAGGGVEGVARAILCTRVVRAAVFELVSK